MVLILSTTAPKAYNYQISAAIQYFLKNEYDELVVEGMNHEDSIFYKDGVVKVIGEAKHENRKNWTDEALFHTGKKIGPIIQLWKRWSGKEDLVFFSSAPTSCTVSLGRIKIQPSRLKELVDKTTVFLKGEDKTNYSLDGVDGLLNRLLFVHTPHNLVTSEITKWCRKEGLTLVNGGVEKVISLFQDETYFKGKRISRSEIIQALTEEQVKRKKPSRELYGPGPIRSIPSNCHSAIAHKLHDILRIYKVERKQEWFKETGKPDQLALEYVDGYVEDLKDLNARCGNDALSRFIKVLEEHPRFLFSQSEDGEKFRHVLRKGIAIYREAANLPIRTDTWW